MIKTIALDYGGVLAYPVSGNWFIPYNFFKLMGFGTSLKLIFKRSRLNKAFIKGNEYLLENHLLFTEDEEYQQFFRFYRIVFAELKMRVADSVIEKFARDAVYNDDRVHIYSDVVDEIKKLKEKYRVVILSDTWPSLKRILKNSGILDLLDGLVMSCSHGKTKETKEFFEIAVKELDLIPEECLFIDDSETNLKNAKEAGFVPVLMNRRSDTSSAEYAIIHNLDEIEAVVEALEPEDETDDEKS